MSIRNEKPDGVKESSTRDEELNKMFEKGRKIGRVEGMIAYQKHLVENLQKENVKLTKQLADIAM